MIKNIAVFPALGANAIEVMRALKKNIHFRAFPISSFWDDSLLLYENGFDIVPMINSTDFDATFIDVCQKYNIEAVVLTHDDAALYFASSELLKNRLKFCNPSIVTANLARDKLSLYNFFSKEEFTPKIYRSEEVKDNLPVFVKPRRGQGGKGTRILKSVSEADCYDSFGDEYVLCQYLPGNEYTVECLTNQLGELSFVGIRQRTKITDGISVQNKLVTKRDDIYSIAHKINASLDFLGQWFFQVKEDEQGAPKLMEISIRPAGSGAFFRHLGVNLPLLSQFILADKPTTAVLGDFELKQASVSSTCFYIQKNVENIYVDYDDTLIVDNKVNHDLLGWLYYCRNLKKNIYLITRHEGSLIESIENNAISKALFDDIIHLQHDEPKSNFVEGNSAIFIDNRFYERYDVQRHTDALVFDVDAIHMIRFKK